MKKTYKYLILFLLLVAGSMSCTNKLDIDPQQSVGEDIIINSSDGVINLLYGAYSGIKGTSGANEGGELYGGDFNLFSELLAADDELNFIGTFGTMRDLQDKQVVSNSGLIAGDWIRAYDVFNMLNLVLANIDVVDADQQDRIKGEALAMRGMLYFDMARFWGLPYENGVTNSQLAVPIRLTPTSSADEAIFVARSSVEDVYDRVLTDLALAETLLTPSGTNSINMSSYAVSAVLSRVYLQMGDYANAVQSANRVIESGEYALVATPLQAYNNSVNTSEDIFAIQQNGTSNAGLSNAGLATFYASLNGAGRGDIAILPPFIALFESGDLRVQLDSDLTDADTYTSLTTMLYIGVFTQNKGWTNTSKWGKGDLNIPVIRLAEMYLTRAEANFIEGTSVGATPLDDINIIRLRAGLAGLGAVDLDIIKKERHLELAWEGFTLHDKKRWQENVGTYAYDAPELILPIPQREIDINPEMVQNEGY